MPRTNCRVSAELSLILRFRQMGQILIFILETFWTKKVELPWQFPRGNVKVL